MAPVGNPATHLYDTTSVDAGYSNGYPVSAELYWVGEYQISLLAGRLDRLGTLR